MCRLLMRMLPWMMAILLPVLTASCSKDPEPEKPKQEEPVVPDWEDTVIEGEASMSQVPMQFNASPTEAAMRGYTTGSTYNSGYTFTGNELVTIGVTGKGVTSRSTSEETKQYQVSNTSTGKLDYTGLTTESFCWLSKAESIDVRAWSYGNGDTPATDPDGQTFSIPTAQNSGTDIKELLYMPSTTKSYGSDGSVTLQLKHMLSRIVITIADDADSSPTISSIAIGNNNVPTTGTFDLDNAKKWTGQGTNGTITPKTETANSIYSAVLIPYTFNSAVDKFISIVIDGETFAYTLPANTEFEAGKQYGFTINVKNRAITFSTTVTAWTADPRNIDFSE